MMPFAFQLVLDHRSSQTIRHLEGIFSKKAGEVGAETLSGSHFPPTADLVRGLIRPVITLGIFEHVDLADGIARTAVLATLYRPLEISLATVGIFPGADAFLFLAPIVTAPLLELHSRFHTEFRHLEGIAWAHHLPKNWIPHCRMTGPLPDTALATALILAAQLALPLRTRLTHLSIRDLSSNVERYSTRLAGP